jgi:hypothetical protein
MEQPVVASIAVVIVVELDLVTPAFPVLGIATRSPGEAPTTPWLELLPGT